MNHTDLALAVREKIANWRAMKRGELYLAAQICADELERLLDAHAASLSIDGLSKDDLIRRTGDVDQGVPVLASGAQEEAPVTVDVGGDSAEHDLKPAVLAGPHAVHSTPIVSEADLRLTQSERQCLNYLGSALKHKPHAEAVDRALVICDHYARRAQLTVCHERLRESMLARAALAKAVAANAGNGMARAGAGGAIFIVERDDSLATLSVFASKVGENGIKPDTWYRLKDGKPVEVSP